MANGGPYKPSRPPQWYIKKIYGDQIKAQNSYQLNNKYMQAVFGNIYIAGRCYDYTTGKLVK
jgi:hypothetical protein